MMFIEIFNRSHKPAYVIVTTIFCVSFGFVAQAGELDIPTWKKMNFVTSILFFTAESLIEFNQIDATSVKPQLAESKSSKTLLAGKNKVNQMQLTSRFLGKESHISLIFEKNLNTLQRTQLSIGTKHRFKAYQFLNNGVYSFRLTPEIGQELLSYSEWTNRGEAHFKYPAELNLQQPIIDSTNLFYIMSSGLFKKPGDKASFTVFVKNQLLTLVLIAQETTELDVDYLERKQGRKEYIEEEVEVLRISVLPYIYNGLANLSTKKNSEFKFLGLNGNLQFYVDTKKRLLVQLSGDLDIVGGVDIVLSEVEF